MEKRQLLLISENQNFTNKFSTKAGPEYQITSVQNVHAGYSLALSYLPDLILIDCPSVPPESLKNLRNFKSSHFLNKSLLFLITDSRPKQELQADLEIDGTFSQDSSPESLLSSIDQKLQVKRCLSNYWRDSFMALFNLLDYPVVLIENDEVIAINDSFRKDFFITNKTKMKLTDLVRPGDRKRMRQALRRFENGKHMKTCIKTLLKMNGKLREATISISKLDKSFSGQMIMMINYSGKEIPMIDQIGSSSEEVENFLKEDEVAEKGFTEREKEIISLLCKGYKTKEISELLCISSKTIEKHRANIVKRTRSGTILESIVYALNNNMVEI